MSRFSQADVYPVAGSLSLWSVLQSCLVSLYCVLSSMGDVFAAQLIHVSCATAGYGDGEGKQAASWEIVSSLLPKADRKKSASVQGLWTYTCNAEPICSLYFHFSQAVTFESNESTALNSLLMRIKANTDTCFEDLGKESRKIPAWL